MVALAQEQRARLGVREAARLRDDALQEDPQVTLASERDPDADQVLEPPRDVEPRGRFRRHEVPSFHTHPQRNRGAISSQIDPTAIINNKYK